MTSIPITSGLSFAIKELIVPLDQKGAYPTCYHYLLAWYLKEKSKNCLTTEGVLGSRSAFLLSLESTLPDGKIPSFLKKNDNRVRIIVNQSVPLCSILFWAILHPDAEEFRRINDIELDGRKRPFIRTPDIATMAPTKGELQNLYRVLSAKFKIPENARRLLNTKNNYIVYNASDVNSDCSRGYWTAHLRSVDKTKSKRHMGQRFGWEVYGANVIGQAMQNVRASLQRSFARFIIGHSAKFIEDLGEMEEESE